MSVSRNKLRFWFNENRALFFNSAVYYCKQKPLVSNAMLAPDRLISYERARLSILFGCSLQLVWVGVTMTYHVQHQPIHLSAQITQLPSGLMGGQVENWVELGLTQIGREVRFQGCILTVRHLSAATRWRFWTLKHCIVLSNLGRRHMFVNSEKTSTSGGVGPVANYRAAGVICELWPIFISVKAISELNKSIASVTNAVPCHSLVL